MTKKRFLLNTLLISGTSALLKCAGLFFRVYLSNTIGAEGMGLYQLIFSLYVFLISLTSAGVSLAVTRVVSEQRGADALGAKRQVTSCALMYVFCTFLAVLIVMSLFAEEICTHFLNDARCTESIKILTYSLLFIGFSAVFKGYFTAEGKAYHISNSQILEDFVKIFTVVFVFAKFGVRDITFACRVIMHSIVLAEMCSCLFLFLFYKRNVQNVKKTHKPHVSRRFLATVSAVSLGGIITSFLHTAENVLIPSGLLKYGNSAKNALSLYGMLRGMAMPVLLFPSSVIGAFSMLLVPEITRADASGEKKKINYAIYRVFQFTFVCAIFISGVFIAYSDEISLLIYKNAEVGKIIKILAPYLPFMYADGVIFALLAGLDMQKMALAITAADSFMRVIMIYFLVPKFGFSGIVATLYVSNLSTPILGSFALFKRTGAKVSIFKFVILPSLAVMCSTALTGVLSGANLMIGIFLSGVLYLVFVRASNVLSHEDMMWIMSSVKLNKKKK